ncbi:MAG: efflux RND transporter periplasmic adaptor subunit [Planctomycetota bacterium]
MPTGRLLSQFRSFLTLPLLFSCCCLLGSGQTLGAPPKDPNKASPVTATRVRTGTAGASFEMLGTVTPRRTATIGFALPGRVQSIDAERGQRVASGEVFCTLRTRVVEIEIAAAKAELRLAEQQLAELEAGSRAEDIAEAKARMDSAKAIARQAKSQLTRVMRLVKSRAASVDEVDVATAEADSSARLLDAATIVHQRLVAGPRIEQVAQAKAQVDLRREQVRLLEDRLSKHELRAPFDANITQKFTEAGSWVTAGAFVVEMIELDTIDVEVAVPASQLANLRVGQSIRLQTDRETDALLIGKIDRIVPAADARSRTFPVMIRAENRIENELPLLLSGMLVRVELPIGPESESLFVPTDAIVLDGARQAVFVIEAPSSGGESTKGLVRKVPIELGVADGDWVAVKGDLSAGSLVVTRGNERLIAGQSVEATAVDG